MLNERTGDIAGRSPTGGWVLGWMLRSAAVAVAAALALWVGLSIPSHFRSVSPLVLEAAGRGSAQLEDEVSLRLSRGQPGMALTLAAAGGTVAEAVERAAAAIYAEYPLYIWSGGSAPFYEEFLRQAQFLNEAEAEVLPSLLPREHRDRLRGFLETSSNQLVAQLLRTYETSGWQIFFPAYSASGQPLDATLLTVALLEQSGAFGNAVRRELERDVGLLLSGDSGALARVEALYAAVLGLGRQADWLELETAVRAARSREDLLFMGAAVQGHGERWPLLLATVALRGEVAGLRGYILAHGDSGWRAVTTALPMGSGAVDALLDGGKPLYHPPRLWQALPPVVRAGQLHFKDFAEAAPVAALVARGMAFALCGFLLLGSMRALLLGRRRRSSKVRLLWQLDRMVGSLIIMLLLWVMIEPGLLEFTPNEEGVIEIQLARILPDADLSIDSSEPSTMIDQVTIIVLLLFLVLQLFVFIFCLLKLAEIRRQAVSAATKLRLLDNEENLFDLGLYVGLGGTVGSLIMVVLNLVDASLMAAYASTLFGIIFVAILKVGYLRPFRRKLILEVQSAQEAPAQL